MFLLFYIKCFEFFVHFAIFLLFTSYADGFWSFFITIVASHTEADNSAWLFNSLSRVMNIIQALHFHFVSSFFPTPSCF